MLTEFTVKKLFGKYNVTLDLTKDANILIGSNGIGKTTILKLFYCLLEGNFIDLGFVPFYKVIIKTDENEFQLNYNNLFPNIKFVAQGYKDFLEDELSKQTYMEEIQPWNDTDITSSINSLMIFLEGLKKK